MTSGSHKLRVWTHTQAYPGCVAPDVAGCLEAAILEVDRTHVY